MPSDITREARRRVRAPPRDESDEANEDVGGPSASVGEGRFDEDGTSGAPIDAPEGRR